MRRFALSGSLVALVIVISNTPLLAETVELVTYYPTSFTGEADRLHARAVTVGPDYSLTNPSTLDNGTLLVWDSVGIGSVFSAAPLAGSLHVVGPANQADKVLFMPGTGGTMSVGIGTTAPGAPLHVYFPASASAGIYQAGSVTPDGTWGGGILHLKNTSLLQGPFIDYWATSNTRWAAGASSDAYFGWRATTNGSDPVYAPKTLVVITPAGNVGIGTTTPTSDPTYTFLSISGPAAGNGSGIDFYRGATRYGGVFAQFNQAGLAAINGVPLTFLTFPGNIYDASYERMRITPSGDVGIGTSNPTVRLDVAQNSAIRVGDAYISSGVGGSPGDYAHFANNEWYDGAVWRTNGMVGALIQLFRQNTYFWRHDAAGINTFSAIIDSNGNMGLGVTLPGYRLDVAGQVHATGFPVSSDIRLKTGMTPLTSVLEKLNRIRPVAFDWNETYKKLGRASGHREIGVVAQDVEAVFPELVTTWGEEKYRAVDYGRFTAVLLEAVKEQQNQIRMLKAENAAIKEDLKSLRRELKTSIRN